MDSSNPTCRIPKKFEALYVFSDTPCRLFFLLTDPKNIKELNMKTQLPYLFTDKPTPLELSCKIKEVTSMEYSRKISWVIDSKLIPCPIVYTFNITPNTLDNTTLFGFELVISNPEKISPSKKTKIISGCKNVCREMINNIEVMLQEKYNNIYVYNSTIIKAKMDIIWKYLVSLKVLEFEGIEDIKIDGNLEEEGCLISFQSGKDRCKCEISKVKKNSGGKKWKYSIKPISDPYQVQEVSFVLVDLGDDNVFLSISHEFNEKIDVERTNELCKRKKIYLNIIKNICERQQV